MVATVFPTYPSLDSLKRCHEAVEIDILIGPGSRVQSHDATRCLTTFTCYIAYSYRRQGNMSCVQSTNRANMYFTELLL